MVAEQLAANGWLRLFVSDPPEEKAYAKITWEGIHAAEEILEARPEYASAIPASDRYVSLNDNQQSEFAQDLVALKEAVRGTNQGADDDDRALALYEIAVFEAVVVAPMAATDLIQRFVESILNWITSKFTGAAVTEIAQRLIQALLKLIA